MKTLVLYNLGACGFLGSLVFLFMWVYGGYLQGDDYSHIENDVSSLLCVGAPHKKKMDILNIISSIFFLACFTGFHFTIREITKCKKSRIATICLISVPILNVLITLFFPLDEGGEPNSWTGIMHVVLVFLQIPIVIISMFVLHSAFKNIVCGEFYRWCIRIIFVSTFVLGILGGATVGTKFMGLVERLSICVIHLYFTMIGIVLSVGRYKEKSE